MRKFIHECVGCSSMGFPCMGRTCKQGYIEKICDWCKYEVDELYKYDGDEICSDCLLSELEMTEEDDDYEVTYLVNGEWLTESDALFEFEKVDESEPVDCYGGCGY